MRSSLLELDVLAAMARAGIAAGLSVFLVRLPGRLYFKRLKGRRARLPLLVLFRAADVLAAFLPAALFALSLLDANGGEPRLYAVLGFTLAAFLAYQSASLPFCS